MITARLTVVLWFGTNGGHLSSVVVIAVTNLPLPTVKECSLHRTSNALSLCLKLVCLNLSDLRCVCNNVPSLVCASINEVMHKFIISCHARCFDIEAFTEGTFAFFYGPTFVLLPIEFPNWSCNSHVGYHTNVMSFDGRLTPVDLDCCTTCVQGFNVHYSCVRWSRI